MTQAFKGKPIAPEVDKIIAAYEWKVNDNIAHKDIAAIAGCKYPSHRYYAITQALRKALMKRLNVDIEPDLGLCYRVLPGLERVDAGLNDMRKGTRKIERSGRRIAAAPDAELDEHGQRKKMHAKRLIDALTTSAKNARKEIGFIGKPIAAPRPLASEITKPTEQS